MNITLKTKFYISCLLRILITIFVLFFTNINLFMKIILIIFSDTLDSDIPKFLFNKWICTKSSKCNNLYYQRLDKIIDSICYIILLYYIISINIFSNDINKFLIFLLIFRLIGVILFLFNNNRKFLFYFPNFFLEISLAYSLINYYDLYNIENIIIIIVIIYKVIQEYFMHFLKWDKKNK